MKHSNNYIGLVLTLALSLAACGGGGSDTNSGTTTPPPVGGISGNGIAIGPIDTFGSIVVNGVRYDTSAAAVTIDGSVAQEGDLKVGNVVTVVGTIDSGGTTGSATTVSTDDAVKGPISSIDGVLSQLVVLGQTVLVRPTTSFDDSISPASLDGLSVGQIVEVSGQFDANGDIEATRIELKPAGTIFEVHGTVAALSTGNSTFSLGSLVVDFSGATLNDFPGGLISNGDFVEAKGNSLGASGELEADIVELENNQIQGDANTRVEIQGFITRFASSADFDVAGNAVVTNGSTVFEGGVAADLGLNIKVEVEGSLDGNGVLVASKVDIRRSKAVRTVALVDSVDASSLSLVMLGITVSTDSLTRFEDKSNADLRPLTINDLNAGDYLEIRGTEFPAGSGTVLATILEREDPDTRTELQGFVATISQPAFSILGVTIDTNGSTVFRDTSDTVISASEFFNQLAPNSLVKARGLEVSDTAIMAEEVEFELEF